MTSLLEPASFANSIEASMEVDAEKEDSAAATTLINSTLISPKSSVVTPRRKSLRSDRIWERPEKASRSSLEQLVANYDSKSVVGWVKLRRVLKNLRDIRKIEKDNADRLRLILKRSQRKLGNWSHHQAADQDAAVIIFNILQNNYKVTESILTTTTKIIRTFSRLLAHQEHSHQQIVSAHKFDLPEEIATKVEQLKKRFMSHPDGALEGDELEQLL